jgi:hypothetical protein
MAHDTAVENWLKRNGYAFRFEKAAALSRIDMVEADANPARLYRKFDDKLAYDYAQDYERGDDFPALVVQEIVGQKLWNLWGGRHRHGGATAALLTSHDMIVVFGETSPARIELARRVLNSIGVGKKDGEPEKLLHIAELRKRHPRAISLDELATHFKVKRPTITRYLAVVASQERADRLGKGMFWTNPKISQELKVEAGRFQSDEVFCAIVELVQNHQQDLRGDSGTDFVKKLRNTMQNDKTRLAAIIDRDKELIANDEEKRTGRKRVPTSKTTRYLGYFRSIGANYPGAPEKLHLGDQGSCATLRRLRKEALKVQDISIDMVAEYDRLIAEAEKVEAWRNARRGASDSAPISPPP